MHKCIICIGSNYNRKENLLLHGKVSGFVSFHSLHVRAGNTTFVFKSPALFSNQVAQFFSEAEEEKVRKELKAIEQSAGRRPGDKKEESLPGY